MYENWLPRLHNQNIRQCTTQYTTSRLSEEATNELRTYECFDIFMMLCILFNYYTHAYDKPAFNQSAPRWTQNIYSYANAWLLGQLEWMKWLFIQFNCEYCPKRACAQAQKLKIKNVDMKPHVCRGAWVHISRLMVGLVHSISTIREQ